MNESKTGIPTEQVESGLNRRDFLKVAGVGAAALALPRMGFAVNDGQKPMDAIPREEVETDVLVIGGGYAGVFAAIKASGYPVAFEARAELLLSLALTSIIR